MGSWEQEVEEYGHDIGAGWMAYGSILYRGLRWGESQISLDTDIQPGDGHDSIEEWTRYVCENRDQRAATAFNKFVTKIFCDPWPDTKPKIRERLMAEGVTHSKWPGFRSRNG